MEAHNEALDLPKRSVTTEGVNCSESILKDGEAHIEVLEAELDRIKRIGIQNYIVEKIRKIGYARMRKRCV